MFFSVMVYLIWCILSLINGQSLIINNTIINKYNNAILIMDNQIIIINNREVIEIGRVRSSSGFRTNTL